MSLMMIIAMSLFCCCFVCKDYKCAKCFYAILSYALLSLRRKHWRATIVVIVRYSYNLNDFSVSPFLRFSVRLVILTQNLR
jgi:hypothetical protein